MTVRVASAPIHKIRVTTQGHGLEIRVFSVMVSCMYNNTKDVMTGIDQLFASLRLCVKLEHKGAK